MLRLTAGATLVFKMRLHKSEISDVQQKLCSDPSDT